MYGNWWNLIVARSKRPKGKSGSGKTPPFIKIPHALFDLPNYTNLGFPAKALLSTFIRQYNGYNNGDLCNAFNVLSKGWGWKTETTIRKATKELIEAGLIIQTRQGGKNKCSLFALTWEQIDECKGKLEIGPTTAPILKLSMQGKKN
jgi:hypothetical protein